MSEPNATSSEPWTILRLLQWTAEHLKKNGSTSPRLDAEILLAEARKCQRIDLYAAFAEEPSEEVKAAFRVFVRRRAAGEPVAYLVGRKEFYSLNITVQQGCLIPRNETEHLVIECLDRAKAWQHRDPDREAFAIADVCTGSGCVAIAVAKHLPESRVVAIDLSDDALAIARVNVQNHALNDRVEVRKGDLLDSIETASLDFVLANPPYVSESEYLALDRSIRDHEPRIALVSGPTGTEIIETLIEQSRTKLRPGGWFLCELSPMIADRVFGILQADSQHWQNGFIAKDLAGLKRLAIAQKT